MARFLLARADEPLVTINQAALDQSTPLHAVCIRGHADLVDWMLTKGADVFAEDHCERTPLAFAARLGFPRIVTALVAAGSDRCSIDRDGRSVLYKAAWGGLGPVRAHAPRCWRRPRLAQPERVPPPEHAAGALPLGARRAGGIVVHDAAAVDAARGAAL